MITCGKLFCVVDEQSCVSGEAGEGEELDVVIIMIMIIMIKIIIMTIMIFKMIFFMIITMKCWSYPRRRPDSTSLS